MTLGVLVLLYIIHNNNTCLLNFTNIIFDKHGNLRV